jgi:CRISPR-associated protein Cmr2
MPDSPTQDPIFWKRKLAAFLHDPPSKALDIRTHAERSEKAMQAAGLGTPEERRDWEHTADHTAAAADRFPFPHHAKASLSCAFDGVRNVFRHPLHGRQTLPFDGRFITVEQALENEQTTQPVLNDLSGLPTDEHDRARFLAHWRLWAPRSAENDWRFAYLPADTRIPDHSIWNHMQIVSALDSCRSAAGGLQPSFLKFQLGPVQDFIAAARSTRDLWSGSYLLSWLMAQGLAKLSLELGPDSVVFPSLREQPLVDLALKHSVWDRVKIGNKPVWDSFHWSREGLLTPNLPNVFLAVVPADRANDLAEAVCDAIKAEWKRISKSVWNDCETQGLWKLADEDGLLPIEKRRTRFDHQIEHFLSLSWAALPWPETLPEIEKLAVMLPPSSTLKHFQSTKAAAETIRVLGQQDDRYFDKAGQLKNEGIAWSVLTALSSWQLDAVRQTREFHANLTDTHPSKQHSKDSLTGKEEAIAGGPGWQGKGKANRFKHDDYLSAPTLVKRLWDMSYLHKDWKEDLGSMPLRMPNTRSLAAHDSFADDADDDTPAAPGERYFAVIAFDGDDMGKWVSGEKAPEFSNQLADYKDGGSLEYFQRPANADKFTGFLQTPRPLSPSYHLQFSECLSNFAIRCVRPIVEAHDGRLIYAGGDDVVALLPADAALACANDLQLAFSGQAPSKSVMKDNNGKVLKTDVIQQKAPGFLTSKFLHEQTGKVDTANENLIPFMVPGPAASASVGIAIAHFKSPLQDTVRAAQLAEKRAKKVFAPRKAAVSITVMKRSGETVEWSARWNDAGVAAATTLLNALNQKTVSAKFPYRLGELISSYCTQSTGLIAAADSAKPVAGFDLAAVFTHELHTVLSRQRGPAWDQNGIEFEESFTGQMKRWIDQMIGSLSLDDTISQILALCAYCGFAKRQGTEPQDEKQV